MSSRRGPKSKPSSSGFRRGFLLSPAAAPPSPPPSPSAPPARPARRPPKQEQAQPNKPGANKKPNDATSQRDNENIRRRGADDSLLSLEQQQPQRQRQLDPLDSSSLIFNDDSSSNNNPLFLVVNNESSSTDRPKQQQQEQQDNPQRAGPATSLLSMMEEVISNDDNSSPLLERTAVIAETPTHRKEDEHNSTAAITEVQNQLAQTLYRLRRRHRHSSKPERSNNNSAPMSQSASASAPPFALLSSIVDPWLSQFPRRLCWEAVLNSISALETLSHRQPIVQLGLYMLQQPLQQQRQLQSGDADDDDNNASAFLSLLRDAHRRRNDDKTTRRQLLAAVNLVHLWMDCLTESLEEDCEHDDIGIPEKEPSTAAIHFLVEDLVPLLAPLVIRVPPASNSPSPHIASGTNKPTVLMHRTVDVLYRIFSLTAQNAAVLLLLSKQQSKPANDAAENFAESVWRHSESVLVELWKLQLRWLQTADDDDDNQQGTSNDWNWSSLSSKEIQRRCKEAVLVDWQQQFQFRCEQINKLKVAEEGHNKSGAATQIKLEWCNCLAGTMRRPSRDGFGSLAQTVLLSSSSMDPWSKIGLLESFWEIEDDSESETTNSATRVRGLVAWIGQKRKHLGLLLNQGGDDEDDDVLKLSVWLLESLASNSSRYCTNIKLVALRALWSMTGGLPPDIDAASGQETGVQVVDLPKSFTLIVGILKCASDPSSTQSTVSSSTVLIHVLCRLAVQCILALGVSGAESIVSRVGMTRETVKILTDILTLDDVATLHSTNGLEKTVEFSCRTLLDHFYTNSLVRAKVHKRSDLFVHCASDDVIPRILTTLYQREFGEQPGPQRDSKCNDAEEGKLIQCLVQFLLSRIADDLPQTVRLFVESLRKTIEGTDICSEKEKGLEHICFVVGRSWRDALFSVTQATRSSHTFGNVFLSTAREFLAQPSEQLHLNLFGAITGHESDFEGVNDTQLGLSVVDILQLSLESMLDGTRSIDIFNRIAPLLLLRRLPVSLLRLAMEETSRSISANLFSIVVSLGEQLSSRLDIRQANGTCAQPYSRLAPDERRLAAEVAGRLLPCGDLWTHGEQIIIPKRCTCFELLCEPAFSKFNKQLADKSNGSVEQDVVRAARASLFVVSTAAQVAKAKDEGTCLFRVARFAIDCLSVEPTSLAKSVREDFVQLQAGCIEFFVLCQQLSFKQKSTTQSLFVGFQSVADQIIEAVKIMLQTGKADVDWMVSSNDGVHEGKAQATDDDAKLLLVARVSLWRSMVAASQRADPSEASRRHMPWITAWLTDEKESIVRDQSYCVAAAMQAVFVLLMRTKTFSSFAGSHSEQGKSVRELYRFVIRVLHPVDAPLTGTGAVRACRSAALTLLLALVTINSITSPDTLTVDTGHLTPSDYLEAFARVQELATNEEDPEIRRISEQILSILRT